MQARATRGFTLVEVLVALVVMATLAGMAWQGVDGMVRARDASQQRLERTLRLNTALAQWEQDLASLQDSRAVPALGFDGATLRMTRRTDRGLQVVAWSLRPSVPGDASSGAGSVVSSVAGAGDWSRWAGPTVTSSNELQESWMLSQQLQTATSGSLRVVSGVAQWQVYFYRGNAWTNAQSSGDVVADAPEAPASGASGAFGGAPRAREALPSGVRVTLQFAQGSGQSGSLSRDVALGPQVP